MYFIFMLGEDFLPIFLAGSFEQVGCSSRYSKRDTGTRHHGKFYHYRSGLADNLCLNLKGLPLRGGISQ